MTGGGLRKNGKRELVRANNDNHVEENFYEMVQNRGSLEGEVESKEVFKFFLKYRRNDNILYANENNPIRKQKMRR